MVRYSLFIGYLAKDLEPLTLPHLAWASQGGSVGRGILLDYQFWATKNSVPLAHLSSTAIPLSHLQRVVADQNTSNFAPVISSLSAAASLWPTTLFHLPSTLHYPNGRAPILLVSILQKKFSNGFWKINSLRPVGMRRRLNVHLWEVERRSMISRPQLCCINGYLGGGVCLSEKCLIWRNWQDTAVNLEDGAFS